MKLNRLLDGPSRITTTLGTPTEITRLAPRCIDKDLRVVHLRTRSVSTVRAFLYPWRRNIEIAAWEVEASITTRGETYVSQKVIKGDYERAVQTVILEVQKKAVLARLAAAERQLAVM